MISYLLVAIAYLRYCVKHLYHLPSAKTLFTQIMSYYL